MEKLLNFIADQRNAIIEEEKNELGYHRACHRPSENCRNKDSYGVVCIKCGKCGRKFFKVEKIKNNMDRFIIIYRLLFKI